MRVAIVYGGGEGVFDQATEARDLVAEVGAEIVTIAINDAGYDPRCPDPLDHWCSLHPAKLVNAEFRWAERRRDAGLSDAYVVWSVSRLHAVVDRVTRRWKGGSSGLLAVDVALRLDLDRVILCGVPLDGRTNEFRGEPWKPHERFRPSWVRDAHEFGDRVRSMSGWTAGLLGLPTLDWLKAEMLEPVGLPEYVRRAEALKAAEQAA